MSQTLTTTSQQDHLSLSTIMEDAIKPPRRLPVEIYQAIIDHLPRSDLKHARLTSKNFAGMSEPRLFSKIVLAPSVDCLNKFLAAFDHSDVRRRIHEFVYDDRWAPSLGRFRKRISDLTDDQMDAKERKRLLDAVDSFNGAYLSGKEDIALEVALLTRIFRRISHCERVHVKEDQNSGTLQFHDVPRFITRVFPLLANDVSPPEPWPRRSSSTSTRLQGVLLSVFGTRRVIHTLRSANLKWSNLFKRGGAVKQLTAFSTLMPYLKNLELLFDGSATSVSPERLERLGHLLRSATSLQCLRLRLHGTPLTSEHEIFQYEFSSDASLLLGSEGKHKFKHLQSISLDSYVTYEHELIRFLRSHSSTLRHLELRNVLLLRQSTDSPRGCWVRVINASRHILKLQSMAFGGCLSNGGFQLWYVNAPPDGPSQETCLRTRIEHYITHRSTICPPELLSVAIGPGRDDLPAPSDKQPWVKGDCSWSMTQRINPTEAAMVHIDDEAGSEEVVFLDPVYPPTTTNPYPQLSHPHYSLEQIVAGSNGGSSYATGHGQVMYIEADGNMPTMSVWDDEPVHDHDNFDDEEVEEIEESDEAWSLVE